jgi:hypothetical protein
VEKKVFATAIVEVEAKPIETFRTVWIVLNKRAICAVFDNENGAELYAASVRKGLALANIKSHIDVVEEKVYGSATACVESYLAAQHASQ